MPELAINVERLSDAENIIHLSGLLTANNFERLEKTFQQLFSNNCYNIIMDLKNLNYISSSGVGVLLATLNTVKENKGKLLLTSLTAKVHDVFALLNLLALFVVTENIDQAKEKLSSKTT